jgi:hypothetical protein
MHVNNPARAASAALATQAGDRIAAANREIVLDFLGKAINQADFEEAQIHLGPRYVQHNPMIGDGVEGISGSSPKAISLSRMFTPSGRPPIPVLPSSTSFAWKPVRSSSIGKCGSPFRTRPCTATGCFDWRRCCACRINLEVLG